MSDQESTQTNLGGDVAPKAPKKEQYEIELNQAQRWNRAQQAFQHMLELEENAKKRLAMTRRDKKLREIIKELTDQSRTGRQLVDKDQVQTALDLGQGSQEQAAELSRLADQAAADFSAGGGLLPSETDEDEFDEDSPEEISRQSGRGRTSKVGA